MNTEVFADNSIKNCHEKLTKSLYAYRLCSPNSPDLNPVDYVIWSVMQERVYTRPECMTLTSCDSVLTPCGVNWNSALWMTPVINGDVVC